MVMVYYQQVSSDQSQRDSHDNDVEAPCADDAQHVVQSLRVLIVYQLVLLSSVMHSWRHLSLVVIKDILGIDIGVNQWVV